MPDQAPVDEQPEYTIALQRELQGLFGSPYMSRVNRRVRRESAKELVSNAVLDEMKLQ
jgi:hypothetical protein